MPRARKSNEYPLNYGWGHGGWTEDDDVLLEACFTAGDADKIAAAVQAWLAGLHEGSRWIDGAARAVRYHGGGWFYAEGGPPPQVYLHSNGEDAFDALHWYANELRVAVERAEPHVRIAWIEHPHHRTSHKLTPRRG